jgi:hypothetical protein
LQLAGWADSTHSPRITQAGREAMKAERQRRLNAEIRTAVNGR